LLLRGHYVDGKRQLFFKTSVESRPMRWTVVATYLTGPIYGKSPCGAEGGEKAKYLVGAWGLR
jgi:hypothetical protein